MGDRLFLLDDMILGQPVPAAFLRVTMAKANQ